ncbi:hypothetical protein N566_27995 [Streptomycetaceae bacterium MP113-05]|nr:hypothetical protein N566_27995 [Streptomycetaceae bacterium MP113-05]
MDVVAALTPPLVMAIGFTALVVTIVRNQGGANKTKEDAAVEAALNSGADRAGGHCGRGTVPRDAAAPTSDG